ncbi:MAG: tetratricopeptide repeat protein [Candidatus Obscuribacter sp.]|nr:tetratricopeptide repeat protein [Candidatus Obscuribacter sp.]
MQLAKSLSLIFMAAQVVLCCGAGPVSAADNTNMSAPASGVEWTKIQDLNPNATATNRPIKQKWAVVIGAAKFKESRLNGMDSKMDIAARNFAAYLKDPNAGRFPETHVKTLINADATRQNILTNLGKGWLGSLAGPDDLVVVFISTHGFPTTDGGTYLSAYDCALDNVYSTCISMQNLMDTLKQEVKTDRIVMVLESPYSGAAELTVGAKALFKGQAIDPEKISLGKGYIIMSSSKPDQMTWGNAFSTNLIAALKAQNGLIDLQQAFAEARLKTESDTGLTGNQSQKKQTPVMKSQWQGNKLVLGAPTIGEVKEIPENVMNFVAAEAHYLKANNFVSSGNFDEALKEYEAAAIVDPTYADAIGDWGAVLAIKGDWSGACAKYKKAIELKPNDALFRANYARALTKSGQEEEGIKQLEMAYQLNPRDRIILSALAGKCIEAGNIDTAINLLEQGTFLFPQSAQMHDKLSYVFAKAGNYSQSLAHAREAVKLDPKLVSAKINLGSALLMKGNCQEAKSIYQETTSIDPKNADAHFLLATTLERLGDTSGARSELTTFLELANKSDPRLTKAKEKLDSLK